MKCKICLMAVLMLTANLYAGDKGWKTLQYAGYKPGDYHLKKGVEYLETRLYKTNADYSRIIDKNYEVTNRMYRKPLSSFDRETVRRFHRIGPNLKLAKETDIHKSSYRNGPIWEKNAPMISTIGGAFFINDKGEVGRMNTIDDLIAYLGDIDTPAELQLVLMFRGHNFCKRYRKTKNGYDVQCEDDRSFGSGDQTCGIYAYRVFVSKRGKVTVKTKERLIKKVECAVLTP